MAPTPIVHRFASPPPPEGAVMARTSTSSTLDNSTTRRSSISVKPTDDPFAAPPLGGEEWRISEESSAASLTLDGAPATTTKKLERRPSFLRSLLPSTLRSRSSTNLSTSSISSPIASHPPRVGPLRTTASLVSLSNRNSFASFRSSTPTTGVFSEQLGGSREGSRPESFVESPPTESGKAFAMLGGPKVTEENRKAVEKLTGIRTSMYTEQDRLAGLGLALTTDETRHVVPDNARLSIFSSTTASTEFGNRDTFHSGATRDTGYSYAASTIPGSVFEEDEEEEYDPLKEDGDATSLHRSRRSGEASRPPPPRAPIPPLPTVTLSDPNYTGGPQSRPPPSSSLPAIPNKNPSRSFARRPSLKDHKLPPTSRTSLGTQGPTKSIAVLYLVAGLPKDPATWTLSEMDPSAMPAHSVTAVPRFWRPEMLGCTVTGEGMEEAEGLMSSLDGARVKGKPKATRTSRPTENFFTLTKEEVTRVQGKVTKLAFNRDVEILASTVQPPSTTASFAFTIPASQPLATLAAFSGSTALAWDATVTPTPTSTTSTTFYAACLTVWSHADSTRSEAIRSTIDGGGRAKSTAINRAAKAASAGRKLGQKLSMQMSSPMGAVLSEGKSWGGGAYSDTESDTDGFATESEWGETAASAAPLAPLPTSTPFWLPYSLILVSHAPIYNLLNDLLRISWARYHQDIASHSLHMHAILHFPAPKPGERISLPVSAEISQADTFFVATMPGSLDWSTGAAANQNFPFWPLFRALDPANLLTVAEVALSPLGRVLFISSHPIMLGLATAAFQFILELRGWRGVVHSTVHARDLKIFIEDPGPYLIAIPSESRAAALADLPPEVAIVDIDSNSVTIKALHPGALSSGSAREKARRRLEAAIGQVGGAYYGVPTELTEAFPAGRFRPFSEVEVRGEPKEAERLRPAASWDWDQARVIAEFDAILAAAPRTTLLSKILRKKTMRRIPELEPGARHVQSIVRKQASNFVDRRDVLEQKINRLNGKLAFLVAESAEWQRSFDVFKVFSDKLTKESGDLKTRLEKERREAKRLTGQVTLEKERHAQLEASLQATETAREQALLQLSNVQMVRSTLEQQRNLLVAEIGAVLAADESSPLYEAVYQRIEALSHRSDTSSRPGTSMSIRSATRFRRSSPVVEERSPRSVSGNDEDFKVTELGLDEVDDEEKLEAMKTAVHETLRSIQSRLAIVLENAGQLDPSAPPMDFVRSRPVSMSGYSISGREDDTMRLSTNSHASSASGVVSSPPETPPSSTSNTPSQDEIDEATDHIPSTLIKPHEPRRFKPKPFQLSPPVSPDVANASTSSFHSSRTSIDASRSTRRISQRAHGNNDSVFSLSSFHEGSSTTPTTATPDRSFSHSRSPSQLSRSNSRNSFGMRDGGVFGTPASRMSNYPDEDDASFVSARSESQGRESPRSDDSDSDVEEHAEEVPREAHADGSVELFTRSASVLGRRVKESIDLGSVEARTRLAPSKLPRPVSTATVRQGSE